MVKAVRENGVLLRRTLCLKLAFSTVCSIAGLGCALFSFPIFALDPHQALGQLYHTSWNAKNGLNGSVMALAQTTDGYLWAGTTDGLYRFDGLYFERYKPEPESLPSTSVIALLAVPDGGLWVGYDRGGASFLKDGQVTNYSLREGLPVSSVRAFARDPQGTIWAAVVGGFARLSEGRWHLVQANWSFPDKSAWNMLVDRQGTLWVAGSNGIRYLPNGEKKFRDMGIPTGPVSGFAQAPDGAFFFQDDSHDALVAFRPPTDNSGGSLPAIKISGSAILFDRDGSMWIAGNGLSRIPFPNRLGGQRVTLSSPEVERFTDKQGLSDSVAEALLEDREGNIWVGTDSGLDRFRYRNVTWFPFPAGAQAFSLVAGDGGDVWAGSKADPLRPVMRVQDGKPAPGGPLSVLMTYRDPAGAIWVSVRNSLYRWKGDRFSTIEPPLPAQILHRSPTKDPITYSSITADRSGNLWVSIGACGEFQGKDGVWKFVQVLKNHPDWASNAAYTDASDRVWLAFGEMVARVDSGRTRTFAGPEGLTVGPFNIIAGRDRQIWVGGESGVAFLQGDRFHTLQLAGGADVGAITGIILPSADGLWLSAGPGIVHVPEHEVQQALLHADYKANYELFDLVSDLPEQLQGTGSVYSSSAIQGSDGLLWFATRSGVARVNPAHIVRNPLPPPVRIRSVVADGRSYSPFAQAALPALTKNLRIDYTALSLSVPERVRYRYKLDGWDKEWQDAGGRRQAFYTSLRPGTYAFHVIACNNDGVWNQRGATVDFSVAPAWFQSAWFRILCLLCVVLLAWIVYRLRMRQLAKAITARFDERLLERTRLARELHDTFLQTIQGSKMVADDALDGPADPARMRRAMEQLSVWLGRATEEGRAALNSLRASAAERNDLAEAFRRATELEPMAGSMTASFSVEGETREMHPIVRDEVYRIGYEAIRNVYLHSHASRLQVELKYAQGLMVRVSDNGVGIDPSISANGKAGHFGLQGMRERAERIGGKLTLVSSEGAGTDITLMVPGGMIFRKPAKTPWQKIAAVIRGMRRRLPSD